jgi:hypothetical protein
LGGGIGETLFAGLFKQAVFSIRGVQSQRGFAYEFHNMRERRKQAPQCSFIDTVVRHICEAYWVVQSWC